jgi:hypothetical protein
MQNIQLIYTEQQTTWIHDKIHIDMEEATKLAQPYIEQFKF